MSPSPPRPAVRAVVSIGGGLLVGMLVFAASRVGVALREHWATSPAAACRYLHQDGQTGSFAVPGDSALAYAAARIQPTQTGRTLLPVIRSLRADQAARRPGAAALDMSMLRVYCGLVAHGYSVTPTSTPTPGPVA